MQLRGATEADLPAIRDCQIASWRTAYKGLLPDDFLAGDMVMHLSDRWAKWPGPHWLVETAWDARGNLTGFASVDRAKVGGPYVDNLHIQPTCYRSGVGRELMARVGALLVAEQATNLWLTVMRDNRQARNFYRAIGGHEAAEQTEYLYGNPVQTYPVHWRDLTALAALSRMEKN